MSEIGETNNRVGFFKINKRFQEVITTIMVVGSIITPIAFWGANKVGNVVVEQVNEAMTIRLGNIDKNIRSNKDEIIIIKADLNQVKIDNILKQASKIKNSSDGDIKFLDVENAIRDYNHIKLKEIDKSLKTSLDVAYQIILDYYKDNKYK